jgi:hypothetical protein
MQKFVDADEAIHRIFTNGTADRVIAPARDLPAGDLNASKAMHHGDFDDDRPTLMATLGRILGSAHPASSADIVIKTGISRNREIRRTIDKMQDFAAAR